MCNVISVAIEHTLFFSSPSLYAQAVDVLSGTAQFYVENVIVLPID